VPAGRKLEGEELEHRLGPKALGNLVELDEWAHGLLVAKLASFHPKPNRSAAPPR